MKISIITLFPKMFSYLFIEGIVAKAIKNKLVTIEIINLRDYAVDQRKTVDASPYGGGPGMLMSIEPLFNAINSLKQNSNFKNILTIFPSPKGEIFNQKIAWQLSTLEYIIIVCGHYEGIDERILFLIDKEISIGDYIITSGNLSAMIIVNCILRLIPGVLGNKNSLLTESFSNGLLKYPQYTIPNSFNGMKVPDVLTSGNHRNINKWRQEQSENITKLKRPDLYKKYILNSKKK